MSPPNPPVQREQVALSPRSRAVAVVRSAGPGRSPAPHADETLRALDDLVDAAEHMAQVTALIRDHAAHIRTGRLEGLSYREIVDGESRPLIVEVFTDAIARFEAAGTRFRQAEAAALRQEGMTLQEIGALFGLTRQRISTLLQDAAGSS